MIDIAIEFIQNNAVLLGLGTVGFFSLGGHRLLKLVASPFTRGGKKKKTRIAELEKQLEDSERQLRGKSQDVETLNARILALTDAVSSCQHNQGEILREVRSNRQTQMPSGVIESLEKIDRTVAAVHAQFERGCRQGYDTQNRLAGEVATLTLLLQELKQGQTAAIDRLEARLQGIERTQGTASTRLSRLAETVVKVDTNVGKVAAATELTKRRDEQREQQRADEQVINDLTEKLACALNFDPAVVFDIMEMPRETRVRHREEVLRRLRQQGGFNERTIAVGFEILGKNTLPKGSRRHIDHQLTQLFAQPKIDRDLIDRLSREIGENKA